MPIDPVAAAATVREHRSSHFVLRFDPEFVSSERVLVLASELESIRTELIELIGAHDVPREPVFADLFTSHDAVPSENDSGATRLADPFLRITGTPEATADTLRRPLVALLLAAAYGEQASKAAVLLDGVCGFLALETGDAKHPAMPRAFARALIRKRPSRASGRGTILASILSGPTAENRRYYTAAVASFLAYLISTHGTEHFREYARQASTTNAAAVLTTVYGRTLVTLEREWRASLPAATMEKHGLWWVVARAFDYWRPYWLTGLLIAGMVFLQDTFVLALSNALDTIVAIATNSPEKKLLHILSIAVVSLAAWLAFWFCVNVVAAVVQNYLTARASASILNDIRLKMFAHLQRLSMRYYAHAQTGDVVAHFTSDLTDVDKGLTSRLPDGYYSIIGITVWTIWMIVQYGQITLVMVVVVPLLVTSTHFFAQPTVDATYRLKRQQAALANVVQENVKAQPVIKIFALQNAALTRLRSLLNDLWHTAVRANFLGQTMGSASSLAITLLTVVYVLVGALMIARGMLSVDGFVGAYVLFGYIIGEAYNLTKKVIPTLLSSAGAMTRIEELLSEPEDLSDAEDAVALSRPTRELKLENVSFHYEHERPILDRVTLTIPIGQFVALVGPSGSGKSTILNLLMRFYDPSAGSVQIDGLDLRHLTQM
ncbi:MAG TPA: ABC transporter ATP-binding protein, partial [Ktedonobacterales bacterium]|nr:ABC transporter ATP-binding protein [Ktedonobacterales bacterium]